MIRKTVIALAVAAAATAAAASTASAGFKVYFGGPYYGHGYHNSYYAPAYVRALPQGVRRLQDPLERVWLDPGAALQAYLQLLLSPKNPSLKAPATG